MLGRVQWSLDTPRVQNTTARLIVGDDRGLIWAYREKEMYPEAIAASFAHEIIRQFPGLRLRTAQPTKRSHQFWFPAVSLPWRTDGRCALFFTPARFWSRRQPLRWELG